MSKVSIGVLTSGGDAQGMNAAVRAVVRMGIHLDADVYAIYDGYQGMVNDEIKKVTWHDVGGIIQEGGTCIGTARSAAFMTREGRKKAVQNLLSRKINRLVIIGGDGSLTGASILSQEWPSLVAEIVKETGKPIDEEHSFLVVVGLVGSIDNDMCGTDQTIGADTALNHIVRAVDSIMSTAASHQREFVVEVMGRNCGWLALTGGIACAADWLIIPENPPSADWRTKMVESIKQGKSLGKKSSIVILAEGARDQEGKPITSNDVKTAIDSCGLDSRITILGHVQRGGFASAWDRNMTTIQAVTAAQIAIEATKDTKPSLVGLLQNKVTVTPLEDCLRDVRSIVKSINGRQYDVAMELRGNIFKEAYYIANTLTNVNLPQVPQGNTKSCRIGVFHIGACAPGMNAAVRAFVRLGLHQGHTLFGIKNGIDGLLNDEIQELKWISVNGWAKEGGAKLGTRRASKINTAAVMSALKKHQLDGLCMIGGWDGYETMHHLYKDFEKNRDIYHKIPLVLIPCSISNNLPCSDFSIGADTALNNIIEAVDKIKQSAVSSNRIFIIEVMGSNGYLAVMSALATGADQVYIPEQKMSLTSLQKDIYDFLEGFGEHTQSCLVINNENASKVFDTPTLAKLFEDQSNGEYIVRTAILGHLQQGGPPTGSDRLFSTTTSNCAWNFLSTELGKENPESSCIGMVEGALMATHFPQMEAEMDFQGRRPKHQWWEKHKWILTCMSRKRGE